MILWNFEVILPKIVEAMARPRIFSLHGIAASNQKKNWNRNHQTIIFFIGDQKNNISLIEILLASNLATAASVIFEVRISHG